MVSWRKNGGRLHTCTLWLLLCSQYFKLNKVIDIDEILYLHRHDFPTMHRYIVMDPLVNISPLAIGPEALRIFRYVGHRYFQWDLDQIWWNVKIVIGLVCSPSQSLAVTFHRAQTSMSFSVSEKKKDIFWAWNSTSLSVSFKSMKCKNLEEKGTKLSTTYQKFPNHFCWALSLGISHWR